MDETETPPAVDLKRLRRRHARNVKAARAEGLMQGIASMLKPGDVVLDCGANVGSVTAVLAASGAEVHAFEPDPYCIEKLRERFADTPNVTLHHAAVGAVAGKVRLMRADNFEENPKAASVKSTIVAGGRRIDESEGHAIEVDLVDLPAFLRGLIAEHGEVAFLKMDIEGAELDLLEAMERDGLFAQVRLTVAETHEKKFRDLRDRFAALRERIAAAYPVTRVNLDWI